MIILMSGVREGKGGVEGVKASQIKIPPHVYFENTVECDRIFQTILPCEHWKLRDLKQSNTGDYRNKAAQTKLC